MRIYLSSTSRDLENHRRTVYAALHKAGLDVGAMEDYVASDQRPVDVCLKDVATSDIYVGIIAWRYGYIPPIEHDNPNQLSITELEYRCAERTRIPKLTFLLAPNAVWDPGWKDEHSGAGDAGARILRFREELGREKTVSFFESPDQLASLVLAAILRHGAVKRVFNVPSLPAGFVARPASLRALKDAILSDGGPPPAKTTALVGGGGFGKSTLATAFSHDPEVIAAFPDGVLWAEVGEDVSDVEALVGQVRDLIKELTGERPDFGSVQAASSQLSRLLTDRQILIVIDDVWTNTHAEPFLQGGRGCAHLMTTRDAGMVPDDASTVRVDAMAEIEAVALLGAGLPHVDLPTLRDLAHRLGEWPLLLKLANGVLRKRVHKYHQTLDEALHFVGEALDHEGLTAFDARDPARRSDAVRMTIGVSLRLLDAEHERPRFFELAVFPEDVDVPIATVARLWQRTAGFDRYRTDKLCEQLFLYSLLSNFDVRSGGTIRLHDAIRKYVRDEYSDREPLHNHLSESWGDPHALPDQYAWRWFGWHVSQSRYKPKLRDLMVDFEWLRAKLAHTDIIGLLSEFHPANVPPDSSTRSIERTLRLSAHVLARDPYQLAGQLLGRLRPGVSPEIDALRETAARFHERPWLRPLRATLMPPDGPLVRTLEGHTGWVRDIAVDSSGRIVVSGADDNTLRVWDLESGVLLRTFAAHDDAVCAVALTPDGRHALTGSRDRTLKIWDLATGALVRTLAGHADWIWTLAVTADGGRAVTGSKDRTLMVWDLAAGERISTLNGHTKQVNSVAVTRDGLHAISGSDDETVKVWDMTSGKVLRTLKGHRGSVNAVAVTPDGQQIVSGSSIGSNLDDGLRIWSLATGKPVRMLAAASGAQAIRVMPHGRRVVAGSTDGAVAIWDLATGELVGTFRGHSSWVSAVAETPDGRHVVSGSHDGTLKVWDAARGDLLPESTEAADREIVALAFTADGGQVTSGSSNGVLKRWDVTTGATISVAADLDFSLSAMALTTDGRYAALGSMIGEMEIHGLTVQANRSLSRPHSRWVSAVAFTSNDRLVVSASADKTLKIWEAQSGKLLRTLKGHTGPVDALAVTPNGQMVLSGSRDGTLKLWNLKSGKEVRSINVSVTGVVAVKVTPDGKQAFLAAGDGSLQLWDLATCERSRVMNGHDQLVRALAVSPDGRHAISGSHDESLKVWNLTTGEEIAAFACDATIECCAISPGGVIACGDSLGIVHFFRMMSWSGPP